MSGGKPLTLGLSLPTRSSEYISFGSTTGGIPGRISTSVEHMPTADTWFSSRTPRHTDNANLVTFMREEENDTTSPRSTATDFQPRSEYARAKCISLRFVSALGECRNFPSICLRTRVG